MDYFSVSLPAQKESTLVELKDLTGALYSALSTRHKRRVYHLLCEIGRLFGFRIDFDRRPKLSVKELERSLDNLASTIEERDLSEAADAVASMLDSANLYTDHYRHLCQCDS